MLSLSCAFNKLFLNIFLISFLDTSSLNDYMIINNSKLHLFIKKAASQSTTCNKEMLWTELRTFLNKHFSETDVELVLKHFKEVCTILMTSLISRTM